MTDHLPRIIILDDDPELRTMLKHYVSDQGFEVQTVANAEQLDRWLQREPFDVLVLDLMMPGEDGLSVCRRLRAAGQNIPILMLTARGNPIDRIVGLEMGADDYLSKPFEPRELTARLNAMVRRQKMLHDTNIWGMEELSRFGPFTLNISRMELNRDEEVIPLSNLEFQLLRVFIANPRRPMSREHLLDKVKGREHQSLDRSLDVQVLRLRRKIEDDPAEPVYIKTVWGVGYIFMPEGDHA
ncbi:MULTISPECIES: response regulator [Shewanella]|uniref:Winged helix family two component transcriptional regulator n=1 Tax=Shewanella fodinae TaxID=552357 RepID=A0A4R2FL11_9GAMM|nr:response regulator [Shewanella fodinae]MCL2906681.1 response regulator [Shewanella fodinae]TCN84278.1 winged helix family two component transcriptional regulator [Shewanella fodinae]GGZ03229.1 DNA-binding response regulator [Shewanella fodinae]